MNNYEDQYGRFHDKPVTKSDPFPCNNSWTYSAYADKAGIELDYFMLGVCFKNCRTEALHGYKILRSPGQEIPVISRDEILGLVALGFLKPQHLNEWSFSPFPIPKFSLVKLIKQVLELKGKHRNYFWENNLDQIYRFAFSVPLSDRHFILKKWNMFKWYKPSHLLYVAIGKINSKLSPGGLDWLKYGVGVKEMAKEFPVDHPVREKLGL